MLRRYVAYPLPVLTDSGTVAAAGTHTTASINHTRPSPRKHSPDVTTPSEVADIRLLLTTHFCQPQKVERLNWPGWLACSGWLTHISGHPSAAGRVQDSESTPATDQCYTTEPHSHLCSSTPNLALISKRGSVQESPKCQFAQNCGFWPLEADTVNTLR